jgi:hypothetical protein
MKRDMELIRKILVAIEEYPNPLGFIPLTFDGYSDQDVSYHVQLLASNGLIEATDCSTMRGFSWRAKRLNWDGHDFIEAIRDDSRWKRAKEWVVETGKTLSIESLKLAVKTLFS